MVIVKIQGGLGNQLFQFAYAYSLSKIYDVCLDTSFYSTSSHDRQFQLDHITNVSLPIVNIHNKHPNKIIDDHHFRDRVFSHDVDYFLEGYWQSEKYFLNTKQDIIDSFIWPVIQDYNFNDSCAVHVRRGDYLKAQHVHHVQTIDYYNQCLDIIQPKGNVYVFSDDVEWCENNLCGSKITIINSNDNIYDLRMMSLCTNNIIANSSFSWWGAWLNQTEDKKILYPKNWFNDNTNTSGLLPSTWTCV